jgi:hypothetical protein
MDTLESRMAGQIIYFDVLLTDYLTAVRPKAHACTMSVRATFFMQAANCCK